MPPSTNPSPADVVAAFQRGGVIEVLKLLLAAKPVSSQGEKKLRGRFGSGSKPTSTAASASDLDQLSPGEVPRSSKDVWLLLVIMAALVIAYRFFTR